MKKKLITMLLASASLLTCEAKDPPTHLQVVLTNREAVLCLLSNRPKVVTNEDLITIYDGELTYEYDVAEVRRYQLGTDVYIDDAISTVMADADGNIVWQAGTIILTGFKPGTSVAVVDIKGVVHRRLTINESGYAAINTAHFTPDIYIVHADKNKFKFIKN